MKRLAIVDDHALFREGLAALLRRVEGVEMSHQVSTVKATLALLQSNRLDGLVLDLRLPDGDARDVLSYLRAHGAERPKVIITSAYLSPLIIKDCLEQGASACVLKSSTFECFRTAIQQAGLCGERAGLIETLTPRERQALSLIAAGLSNRQIAEAMGTTQGTVKNYISQVLQKLDSPRRSHALLRAQELGLL